MNLSSVDFFSDSNREYKSDKKRFDRCFWGAERFIPALMENDNKFIVYGAKGTGKTAIVKKINFLAENSEEVIVINIDISQYNFAAFSEFVHKRFDEMWRAYDIWMLIFYLCIFEYISLRNDYNELVLADISDDFAKMVRRLGRAGLISKTKSNTFIINDFNLGFDIQKITASFSVLKKEPLHQYPFHLCKVLKGVLDTVVFHKNLYILIDGTDEIIKSKDFENGMISDMLRAANDFNVNNCFHDDLLIKKVLLFIREDILKLATDTDDNKMKRDCALGLHWRRNYDDILSSDIFMMVYNRLAYSGVVTSHKHFKETLHKYFGYKQNDPFMRERIYFDAFSLREILRLTLNKPRDLLMLFDTCKNLYPEVETLSEAEYENVKREYGKNYFMEEMKNELAHFIEYQHIQMLERAFYRLLNRPSASMKVFEFSYNAWRESFLRGADNESNKDADRMLELLFERGYVGVISKTRNPHTDPIDGHQEYKYEFRSDGSMAVFEVNRNYVLHYALQKAYTYEQ